MDGRLSIARVRMVFAGQSERKAMESRESRVVAAVLMRGTLARSRRRQEKELKWMAWVRQIEVWCVGAGWAPWEMETEVIAGSRFQRQRQRQQ